MGTFILILIVIVGVLLGLVILVQNPKGGGLATGFSGAHQIGGVQRTAHFLEKATWYLVIALMILCVLSSYYYSTGGVGSGSGMGDQGDSGAGTQTEQTDQPADQQDPNQPAQQQDPAVTDGDPAGAGQAPSTPQP